MDEDKNFDEPVFVLRAQDRFAPEVIEFWASRVGQHVAGSIGDLPDKTKRKVSTARAKAHLMRAWQELNRSKTPD